MQFVRLNKAGMVIEVFAGCNDVTGEAVLPTEVFPADLAEQFVEAPDDVATGWMHIDGGKFEPPAPPPKPVPPPPAPVGLDLVARQLVLMVDHHINSTAQALGYESIVTAVSYANEPAVPRFQAEGAALRAWRSIVYAEAFRIQAAVQAGKRDVPSPQELLALLPTFQKPKV